MSAESFVISALVEENAASLRTLYSQGINSNDFSIYDEEMKWIERRIAKNKTVNKRIFRQRFPEFEYMVPSEGIRELVIELKEERAFEQVTELMVTLGAQLEKDNALDLATLAREQLSKITRAHAPMSDVDLDEWEPVMEAVRQSMVLARQGQTLGIKTGISHLDHHWGGLKPGQFIEILGRTGSGKSYFVTIMAWMARKQGVNVGIFSPEFNAHEVRCRYHTLASADKEIQAAVGLERSFRNRALMDGHGFNPKTYERFMQHVRSMPGAMHLLSGVGMSDQMSVGYIEDRIVDLELDFVIVDPIYLLKPVRLTGEGNVYQEVAWVAEYLHRIGAQYNIPIVFTNQAHEGTGGEQGDAPHKSKSWGSKAINHMADYVLGIQHYSDQHKFMVRGTKSRFGADNFRFEMDFFANTGVWKVITPLNGNFYKDDEPALVGEDD